MCNYLFFTCTPSKTASVQSAANSKQNTQTHACIYIFILNLNPSAVGWHGVGSIGDIQSVVFSSEVTHPSIKQPIITHASLSQRSHTAVNKTKSVQDFRQAASHDTSGASPPSPAVTDGYNMCFWKQKQSKKRKKKSLLVVFRQRCPRRAPPLPSLLSSCSQLSDELTSVADGGVHENRLQGRCGDLRRDCACVTT